MNGGLFHARNGLPGHELYGLDAISHGLYVPDVLYETYVLYAPDALYENGEIHSNVLLLHVYAVTIKTP